MSEHRKKTRSYAPGTPSANSDTISRLQKAFPDFTMGRRKQIGGWAGKASGSYNEMAEFVHFVVEDLYEKGRLDETRRAFQLLDGLLVEENDDTRGLIGLGFFETLHCWRPYGSKAFEDFLGPMSKQVWSDIQRVWAGHSSLRNAIRSESKLAADKDGSG
jgi:hypothetical protein